jgi:hypothetical protein
MRDFLPVKSLQIEISDEADNGTLSTESALSPSTRIALMACRIRA